MNTPWRDDNVTTMPCPVCGAGFQPIRRQRYCTPACRQAAYRRRRPATATITMNPPAHQRDVTVYTCPECDQRYLAEQWCPDCQRPCTRTGTGGACPHCDEPVTVEDLLDRRAAAATINYYAQPRSAIEAGSQ